MILRCHTYSSGTQASFFCSFSYRMNVNRIILFLFSFSFLHLVLCMRIFMHHTYQYIRVQRPMQRYVRCICRSSFFQPVLSRGLGARNGSVHPICHGQFREGAKNCSRYGDLQINRSQESSERKVIWSFVFGGALPLIFKPKYINCVFFLKDHLILSWILCDSAEAKNKSSPDLPALLEKMRMRIRIRMRMKMRMRMRMRMMMMMMMMMMVMVMMMIIMMMMPKKTTWTTLMILHLTNDAKFKPLCILQCFNITMQHRGCCARSQGALFLLGGVLGRTSLSVIPKKMVRNLMVKFTKPLHFSKKIKQDIYMYIYRNMLHHPSLSPCNLSSQPLLTTIFGQFKKPGYVMLMFTVQLWLGF